MKRKLLVGLFLTALTFPFLSFAETEASWNLKLDHTINWQKVTSYGYYIVQAGTDLYGVNPESGEISWRHDDVGALEESSYQEIRETPFFILHAPTANGAIYGFNPVDGQILFNTTDLGITTINKIYPLKRNNSLMLLANENGNDTKSMLVIDLASGKKKWSNSEDFGKLTGYTEINSEEFMMSSFAFIYRVNSNTGEIVYKESAMGDTGGANAMQLGALMEALGSVMLKDEDLNITFHNNPVDKNMVLLEAEVRNVSKDQAGNEKISYSVSYTAFRKSDGSAYWKEPYKLDGNSGSVHFLEDAVIVSPLSSGKTKVNKLSYSSGEGLWGKKGKGITLKGSIISYQDLPEGILVVNSYEKQFSADTDLYVNILNPETGEEKFSKPAKIKGILEFTEMTPVGLLYKTNLEIDFINLADGSTLLTDPIRSALPFGGKDQDRSFSAPMAVDGDVIYTYADKEKALYKINKTSASTEIILEDIKLEGKEIPTGIELFEDGIVISSDQNILKTTFDGEILYQSYFPAPSSSGFKKALLLAQAARAFYVGAAYKMTATVYTAGAAQTEDEVEGAIYSGMGAAFDEGGDAAMSYAKEAMSQVSARFKATEQSRDYIFMMTEETKKEYALIQVDKNDGSVKQKIIVGRDKDPNYAVDDISSKIFYASEPNTITCYTFD